jgi:HD superfamily phosphohydrolase YqeK
MDLTGSIESAEKEFKQILEDFFISVYTENHLSSHGIDHHRRVWNYAKDLIRRIPLKNNTQIIRLPSEAIIACYLHDIGMAVDRGPKHGKQSRDLCKTFFAENKIPENDWLDVLEAIENHDNKDYISNTGGNELLTVLSVADDLDAFGLTGVFRYTEIYLAREIRYDKIGYMIRENARKRYDNFINVFGAFDELVVKHWERYYLLDMFFTKYNDQLPYYQFGTELPSGFCGVVEIISSIMKNNLPIEDFYNEPNKHTSDPLIIWYLVELKSELLEEHKLL